MFDKGVNGDYPKYILWFVIWNLMQLFLPTAQLNPSKQTSVMF